MQDKNNQEVGFTLIATLLCVVLASLGILVEMASVHEHLHETNLQTIKDEACE